LTNQGAPIGGYANGFVKIAKDFMKKGATVDILEKRPHLGPEIYADFVDGWIKHGATIVGGCCEVGPAHIEELARRLKSGQIGEPNA
jgi:S-methylmethionine-dependent homocysteine/selenocysteine methylase